MGDLGVFSSKFRVNSQSLKEFDDALRSVREMNQIVRTADVKENIDKLLTVIGPISEVIEGNLSESTAIDERSVVDILRNRRETEWYAYQQRILELASKLRCDRFQLTQDDMKLLNDIADALDVECANLFRRMSGR